MNAFKAVKFQNWCHQWPWTIGWWIQSKIQSDQVLQHSTNQRKHESEGLVESLDFLLVCGFPSRHFQKNPKHSTSSTSQVFPHPSSTSMHCGILWNQSTNHACVNFWRLCGGLEKRANQRSWIFWSWVSLQWETELDFLKLSLMFWSCPHRGWIVSKELCACYPVTSCTIKIMA